MSIDNFRSIYEQIMNNFLQLLLSVMEFDIYCNGLIRQRTQIYFQVIEKKSVKHLFLRNNLS